MTRFQHSRFAVALLAVALASPVVAQTYVRTDEVTYNDSLGLWVLGQPATSYNVETDVVESETKYNFYTALPTEVLAFGKVQRKMGYHPDGTLAYVADMRSSQSFNTAIQFSNWKRGIPQQIDFPGGFSKKATVDDYGLIRSVTDENGYKTCYSFDPMGRLTRIDYPNDALDAQSKEACGTDRWNPLVRSFVQVTGTEFGLATGHWKETVSTGNGVSVKYYDALWRPVVAERYDSADKAATLSQTVTRYDTSGGVAYQSYPTNNIASYLATAPGITTTYDALGRPTRVEQATEHPTPSVTTTAYTSGFKTEVTNPRAYKTTTAYLTFDQPTTDWPLAITHPEGAYTDFQRDVFGKPVWMRRRNADTTWWAMRTYGYNDAQELCRVTEPETGTTYMGYDLAGNLAWSSAGNLDGLSCDPEATNYAATDPAVAARKSTRTYDQRSRLTQLTFADDIGEQTWTYTPDSLPASITTYNGANQTIPVVNAYSYNKRRMLGGQGETLEQVGWYTWSMGYGYDRNGSLANHVYPTTVALTVDYLPNALGQATKAGTFASNATYFPNGALKQFTYGNNIVHTMTQNARQLPDRSRDVFGASPAVLDDSYDYDQNGNVLAISDGLVGAAGNRTMTYDGLDRLTSANAPVMFGGTISYTYDELDNLQTVAKPNEPVLRYCYDGSKRLTFIRENTPNCTSGASRASFGWDAQGNVLWKNELDFVFSFDSRLRSVTGLESYRYDGHGRRILSNGAGGNLFSLYSNDGVIRHITNGRAKQRVEQYVYLAGSLVAVRETPLAGGASVVKYQHTDALGTPVVVTDASRNIIEQNRYEPYGKLLGKASDDNPGFTGHVEDAATGLTYMQQRYYDPDVGRFLSVDPITANSVTGTNFNRYWYANNSPYMFTDPDGRWSAKAHDTIIAKALGGRISSADVKAIQKSSRDFDKRTQGDDESHMHSMAREGQSPQAAKNQRDAFVGSTMVAARNAADSGDREAALRLFGEAIHPVMDSASPEHTDSQGDPLVWRGLVDAIGHSPVDFVGNETSSDLSQEVLQTQAGTLNAYYDFVFREGDAGDVK